MSKTLRPFFCYYGGKWRAAPTYPAPRYGTIVEPFAGSAGYSLRHPSASVVLYDADPLVASLWRYLVRVTPAEILALPETVAHVDDVQGPQEARWLVGFWLNKGTSHPRTTPSAWMRRGLYPAQFWSAEIRSRIASQVEFIRHWEIHNAECWAAPNSEATWFIDPPYASDAGRHYRHNVVDFDALGLWCQQRKGQVIVCEQQGATWLPFRRHATLKGTPGKKRSGRSAEVIWTNDPMRQMALL